ncbi:MAG: TonB-dependent receptor, partial [Paramuribaculum sp.]|nr:TonB-dependent receptor [Paramuribaculum sp.]
VNIFHIDGKNLIQTLPNPSGSGMLNQNTGKIDNSGIEFQGAWRISRSWSVDANYSYLHMERPIIAAPEHKLHAGTTFTRRRWSVSTGIQYIAGLYTAVDPDTRESFVLWNLRSSYRPAPPIEIWARGENLLAQRYEINAGYPMPRATVTAGINLRF